RSSSIVLSTTASVSSRSCSRARKQPRPSTSSPPSKGRASLLQTGFEIRCEIAQQCRVVRGPGRYRDAERIEDAAACVRFLGDRRNEPRFELRLRENTHRLQPTDLATQRREPPCTRREVWADSN